MAGDSPWRRIITGALSIFFGLALLAAVYFLARPLAFLILSIALAAALSPLVNVLDRRLPRIVGVVVVYLALILVIILLGWLILPTIINQAVQLSGRVPDYFTRIEDWISSLGVTPSSFSLIDTLASQGSRLAGEILSWPLTVGSSLFELFLVLFISMYALIEAPRIRAGLASLFPADQAVGVTGVLNAMASAMGGYLRGSAINGIIIGVASALGFLWIGLEYAFVLGVLAGVLELLPVLGPIIAGTVAVMIALVQSPQQTLIVLGFVILIQQVENNLLVPFVMRSQAEISPLVSIVAVFAGGAIGGLLGAIIAIPVAAALTVLVRLAIAPAIRRANGLLNE